MRRCLSITAFFILQVILFPILWVALTALTTWVSLGGNLVVDGMSGIIFIYTGAIGFFGAVVVLALLNVFVLFGFFFRRARRGTADDMSKRKAKPMIDDKR